MENVSREHADPQRPRGAALRGGCGGALPGVASPPQGQQPQQRPARGAQRGRDPRSPLRPWLRVLGAGSVPASPGVRRGLVLSLPRTKWSPSSALGPPRAGSGPSSARTVRRGSLPSARSRSRQPRPAFRQCGASRLSLSGTAPSSSRFPAVWRPTSRPALPALRQVSRGPGGLRQVPGGGARWVRWTWGSCSATR